MCRRTCVASIKMRCVILYPVISWTIFKLDSICVVFDAKWMRCVDWQSWTDWTDFDFEEIVILHMLTAHVAPSI